MKIYLYSIIIIAAQLSAFCDEAAEKKQLNDAMAERAALMVKSHQKEVKINKAWNDKNITSPEIVRLRECYQKLKFEMVELREKLKTEVQKLPQVQQQVEEVKVMRVRREVLEKKIKELKK